MKFLKKIILINVLFLSVFANSIVFADKLFGFNDPPGCGGDAYLPNLMICGRNPVSAGPNCAQFTKPCNLGDLIETGNRVLVWVIAFALLLVPILLSYYGAMIIWNQNMDGDTGLINFAKNRLKTIIIYFILMLAAWVIVKTVIEVFQVDDSRVPIFLLDESGRPIEIKSFNPTP